MLNFDKNYFIKYATEGFVIAIVANYLSNKKASFKQLLILGTTAFLTFMILDTFAPSVVSSTRQGAGFGLGYGMTHGKSFLQGLKTIACKTRAVYGNR